MASINEVQPMNKNFLSQLEFRFILKRAPHVNFFLQTVNIPQINLPSVKQPNYFADIPHAGDKIDFGPLSVEFKVDEQFLNYMEIHNWLYGLGFPQTHEQYKALQDNPTFSGESLRSDISLQILTSHKRPNFELVFVDAFPTSLSDLVFTTKAQDTEYLSALATFDYTYFTISRDL